MYMKENILACVILSQDLHALSIGGDSCDNVNYRRTPDPNTDNTVSHYKITTPINHTH